MTSDQPSSGTVSAIIVWAAFAVLLGVGVWFGLLVPLLYGVVSRLPLALIALAAAAVVGIVYFVRQGRAVR